MSRMQCKEVKSLGIEWQRFYEQFVKPAAVSLIFDLNVLLTNPKTGLWDPANAYLFMEFSQAHNMRMDFELGNGLC